MRDIEHGQVRNSGFEINFSMQNMVDGSTLWALIAPIEMYSAVARRAGYSGIEYFPFRIPHTQVRTGLITRGALGSIESAHQSFRTERTLRHVRQHPDPKLAIQAFVTLTEKFDSLKDLAKLQRELGHRLPVVVYPPNEWMGETRPEIFKRLDDKLIQPAPELLGAWGINTATEFVNEARNRGYDFCLDLFHIRRLVTQGFQTQFGKWQDVLPVLLPHTREINLAVGRGDFDGPFDSMQELKDLYTRGRKSAIIPILEMVRDFGWTGPIVTEIPATSAKSLISNSRVTTPRMLISVHKQIVENLRSIMGEI